MLLTVGAIMKTKETTITFGVSSHYFKTSISITYESKEEKDFDKALKLARKEYFKALAEELKLKKRFDNMSFEEIEEYVKEKAGIK